MDELHNIFISHRGEDEALVHRIKRELEARACSVRDSSITSENGNNARNEEYIKSLLRPVIEWAGKIIVIVSPDTKNHPYVDWEIEEAAGIGDKRIIGVCAPDATGCQPPEALERVGDALVPWDIDAVIAAIEGADTWQDANGADREPRPVRRAPC